MSFPENLTSVLTGATVHQLRWWRTTGLVTPEIRPKRPPLYSFRDLLLLRSVVFLRSKRSSQQVHKAIGAIPNVVDAFEHPSEFLFGVDDSTIYLGTPDGEAIDILRNVGQPTIFTFEEMLHSFPNFKGTQVPDFHSPEAHIEVHPGRLGGWPTVAKTRIPFNTIAQLVDYETVYPEDVEHYYPTVSADAAQDAVTFQAKVDAA